MMSATSRSLTPRQSLILPGMRLLSFQLLLALACAASAQSEPAPEAASVVRVDVEITLEVPVDASIKPPVFPATWAGDSRMPLDELFYTFRSLLDAGWSIEFFGLSQPPGTQLKVPLYALTTEQEGPAVWFISGIHGEEPAGPNALAQSLDVLIALGKRMPVVILPMANPHGYARNWRYLNLRAWSADAEAQSVGDSAHLLPDPEQAGQARAAAASSPEALRLTQWVLNQAKRRPPRWSIDLHEDNLINEGYVYSQGVEGVADPFAMAAIEVLRQQGVPVKTGGTTRFDETIENGLIGPQIDSSIDELISAREVLVDGVPQAGPAAHTVLVFETPAAALPLEQRVAAHKALIAALAEKMQ